MHIVSYRIDIFFATIFFLSTKWLNGYDCVYRDAGIPRATARNRRRGDLTARLFNVPVEGTRIHCTAPVRGYPADI